MNADVTGKAYQVLHRDDAAMWGGGAARGKCGWHIPDLKDTAKAHAKVAAGMPRIRICMKNTNPSKSYRTIPQRAAWVLPENSGYKQYGCESHLIR